MASAIGARIKEIRKRNNLTLSDLADRIGVSAGTISKIENGKVSPTFQNLIRLAESFGIPLGDLVSAEQQEKFPTGRIAVSRRSEASFMRTPSFEINPLCATLMSKRMTPLLERVVATDVASGDRMISHGGEEFIFVLKGELEVHTELYAPIRLGVGDSAYYDSQMAHTFISVSPEPAEILMVWMPPAGSDRTEPTELVSALFASRSVPTEEGRRMPAERTPAEHESAASPSAKPAARGPRKRASA